VTRVSFGASVDASFDASFDISTLASL